MTSENHKHSLLRSLLSNSLPVLCKNGLGIPDVQFSVEAFVGITVGDGEEVILVSIKETITSDGSNVSHVWSNPEENSTSVNAVNNNIKEETTSNINYYESDVCDLTNEPDDCNSESTTQAVNKEQPSRRTFLRNSRRNVHASNSNVPNQCTDVDVNRLSYDTLVKKESGCSVDVGENVYNNKPMKREHNASNNLYEDDDVEQMYESAGNNYYDNINTTKIEILDDEDENNYSSNYTTFENRPRHRLHLSRRGSMRARLAGGGRSRFTHRGKFRRFGNVSNSNNQSNLQNVSDFISPNEQSLDDLSHLNNSRVAQQDGAYQDLMKEVCEQVVSQSMSAETQYVCHICQARRCSKSSLMDHIRGTHLAMDKYTCKECGERFRWFMQLHRHRKKFHPEPDYEAGDDQIMMGDGDYAPDDDGSAYQGFIGNDDNE